MAILSLTNYYQWHNDIGVVFNISVESNFAFALVLLYYAL